MSGKSMSKFPFTATQWQELEHQALIYKYMASGIPVPPDLLFTIKRSHLESSNSSSLPSKLLISHHPQHVGWNCFQVGLGRKIDPEPGRCRRTDGKKWRCSKEAFPDSKYCERHMHRGKNRSRKPVEVLKTPTSITNTATNGVSTILNSSSQTPTLNKSSDNNCLSSSDQSRHNLHYYPCFSTQVNGHNVVEQNPSLVAYQQYHTASSRPNGVVGLSSSQDSNGSMLDSDLRNRYVCGVKDDVDEHAFFSEEPSRTVRGLSSASSVEESWKLTPLTMSLKQNHDNFYLQLQSANFSHKNHDQQHHHQYKQLLADHDLPHHQQHFDLFGRDLVKLERREDQTKKTIHFFDEWPVREKDSSSSWLDLDDKSSNTNGSISTSQLSISMPKSSYESPIFSSRNRNGE